MSLGHRSKYGTYLARIGMASIEGFSILITVNTFKVRVIETLFIIIIYIQADIDYKVGNFAWGYYYFYYLYAIII